VLAATLSALVWRGLTWWWGLPSSLSHGLVGGLVGAGWMGAGLEAVNLAGLYRVLVALFVSPALGLALGWLMTGLIFFLAQRATPRVNRAFRLGQIGTALLLALSYGANDAQKTIGLLALAATVVSGAPFTIPVWAIALSVAMTALGILTTGWRLIRTLGAKFYRIRPVHGLAAQLAAAGVILAATALGGPVSTTQVVSTSILGAGAAQRLNMVRWRVATDILWAWVLTLPATAVLGAVGVWLLERVGG
jgi:PiT family inorganic phosphate transporter